MLRVDIGGGRVLEIEKWWGLDLTDLSKFSRQEIINLENMVKISVEIIEKNHARDQERKHGIPDPKAI